jgi:hypothetical protein
VVVRHAWIRYGSVAHDARDADHASFLARKVSVLKVRAQLEEHELVNRTQASGVKTMISIITVQADVCCYATGQQGVLALQEVQDDELSIQVRPDSNDCMCQHRVCLQSSIVPLPVLEVDVSGEGSIILNLEPNVLQVL